MAGRPMALRAVTWELNKRPAQAITLHARVLKDNELEQAGVYSPPAPAQAVMKAVTFDVTQDFVRTASCCSDFLLHDLARTLYILHDFAMGSLFPFDCPDAAALRRISTFTPPPFCPRLDPLCATSCTTTSTASIVATVSLHGGTRRLHFGTRRSLLSDRLVPKRSCLVPPSKVIVAAMLVVEVVVQEVAQSGGTNGDTSGMQAVAPTRWCKAVARKRWHKPRRKRRPKR